MVKYAIAKQLAGKRIITTDGEDLGRVIDLFLDEVTGKLETILLEPNPDSAYAGAYLRPSRTADGPAVHGAQITAARCH